MAEPMERLQILVTPEQRRRLLVISGERDEPVTSLVRKAIDATYPFSVDGAARQAAARRFLDRSVGPAISVEEMDAMIDDRYDLPG